MKQMNRWVGAVFGVLILIFAGLVYAWSVLSTPIAQEFSQWSKAQLSLTFTLVMIMFCVGGLIGGFLINRLKARYILWLSAVLFLVGFFLTSKIQSLAGLYICFGVICGLASGFAYNAVMSTVGKWFPDKPGLISGILLMGFGLGSFIIGKVYQAVTPETIGAWRGSFLGLGIITAVVCVISSFFIRLPGADFVAPAAAQKKSGGSRVDMNAGQMVRKPQFWLYYVWAILLSAAGLALVSQASGIAGEIGPEVAAGTVATVVGLISVFNGLGRVLLGGMYDKLGRSKTMLSVSVIFIIAGAILIAALVAKSFTIMTIGFIVGGLAYSGVTPTNSAFTSDYFGLKHYPINFSLVNSNLIFASFGSTIAGALFDTTQSFMSTYFMMLGLAVVGILVSLCISLCDRKDKKAAK